MAVVRSELSKVVRELEAARLGRLSLRRFPGDHLLEPCQIPTRIYYPTNEFYYPTNECTGRSVNWTESPV